jgi:sporulation protein YlmC with PRC-barrel domain
MKKLIVVFAVGFVICAFVANQVIAAEQTKKMSVEKRVSEIIGKTVVDNQNQKVGKVEDLLMDNASCVGYVILSHGGLLGIGEKYVPIPWSQFAVQGGTVRVDSSGDVVVNISKAKLEQAPNFDKSKWDDLNKGDMHQKIDQYYAEAGMQSPTGGYERPATAGERKDPMPGKKP